MKPLKIWTMREIEIEQMHLLESLSPENTRGDIFKIQNKQFVSLNDLQERTQLYKKYLCAYYDNLTLKKEYPEIYEIWTDSRSTDNFHVWLFDFCFKQIKEAKKYDKEKL